MIISPFFGKTSVPEGDTSTVKTFWLSIKPLFIGVRFEAPDSPLWNVSNVTFGFAFKDRRVKNAHF
jgi:hypothetical protein